jgi:hypothetical protein
LELGVRILIGTPIYEHQVLAPYHLSVLDLVADFARRRPEVVFVHRLLDSATVQRARNALASMVLEGDYTHLLFVDADMGFRPSLIEKMIAFDQPLVGAVYPERRQHFPRVLEVARQIPDPESARFAAQGYVGESQDIVREPGGGIRVRNGFVRLRRGGTGIMLIRRSVLQQMRETWPELAAKPDGSYRDMGVRSEVFQPFESFPADDGIYVSEDYAFTTRWVEGCGGEIWACINETITHTGRQSFVGNFERKLSTAAQVR